MEAEPLPWWLEGCHGRRMEAHWSTQWSLNGRYWWYQAGRSIAQIDTQCLQQYAFFTGRPMADHCASILRPRWCVCLPHTSFKRPVSDRPPRHRRPLCDCFEHAQNFTASMASMARSERLCATLERPRKHFSLHCASNGDLARHMVVQGRHNGRTPCVNFSG